MPLITADATPGLGAARSGGGLSSQPTFPVAAVPCVPFTSSFTGPDGPIPAPWTIQPDPVGPPAGVLAVQGSHLVATPVLQATQTPQAVTTLSDVPTYVEVVLDSYETSNGGPGSFAGLIVGQSIGTGATTNDVQFQQGEFNDWAIVTVTNGVPTVRASVSGGGLPFGQGTMRFTRSHPAGAFVYTGTLNGVPKIVWTDLGHVADSLWGTEVGFYLGWTNNGASATATSFDTDGCA